MIMRTRGKAERGFAMLLRGVPDHVIGAYFTLFPAVIAAFLLVQAVRAHAADTVTLGPAQQTGTAVAR